MSASEIPEGDFTAEVEIVTKVAVTGLIVQFAPRGHHPAEPQAFEAFGVVTLQPEGAHGADELNCEDRRERLHSGLKPGGSFAG